MGEGRRLSLVSEAPRKQGKIRTVMTMVEHVFGETRRRGKKINLENWKKRGGKAKGKMN